MCPRNAVWRKLYSGFRLVVCLEASGVRGIVRAGLGFGRKGHLLGGPAIASPHRRPRLVDVSSELRNGVCETLGVSRHCRALLADLANVFRWLALAEPQRLIVLIG